MKSEINVSLDQDSFKMLIVRVFNVKLPPLTIFSHYKPKYVKMTSLKNTLQVILIKYQRQKVCLLTGDTYVALKRVC